MTKKVITVGLVVLVGSLMLNVEIVLEPTQERVKKEKLSYKNSLEERIKTKLVNKGVESQAVQKLLDANHNLDIDSVDMLCRTLDVSSEKVIDDISNKLLHKKVLDLHSSDTLISLAQSLKGVYIPSEALEEIHSFTKSKVLA